MSNYAVNTAIVYCNYGSIKDQITFIPKIRAGSFMAGGGRVGTEYDNKRVNFSGNFGICSHPDYKGKPCAMAFSNPWQEAHETNAYNEKKIKEKEFISAYNRAVAQLNILKADTRRLMSHPDLVGLKFYNFIRKARLNSSLFKLNGELSSVEQVPNVAPKNDGKRQSALELMKLHVEVISKYNKDIREFQFLSSANSVLAIIEEANTALSLYMATPDFSEHYLLDTSKLLCDRTGGIVKFGTDGQGNIVPVPEEDNEWKYFFRGEDEKYVAGWWHWYKDASGYKNHKGIDVVVKNNKTDKVGTMSGDALEPYVNIYSVCKAVVIMTNFEHWSTCAKPESGRTQPIASDSMGYFVVAETLEPVSCTINGILGEYILTLRYMHMKDLPLVRKDDEIDTSTQLGIVGHTGISSHAHIHFDANNAGTLDGAAINQNNTADPEELFDGLIEFRLLKGSDTSPEIVYGSV